MSSGAKRSADDPPPAATDDAPPTKPKKAKGGKATSAPVARDATPRAPAPAAGAQVLKILSVNVAGLRAVFNDETKIATLKGLIEGERPDVLAINEHKLQESHVEEMRPRMAELLPGFAQHWTCSGVEAGTKKGYSGVALFVREAEAAGAPPPPRVVAVSTGMGAANADDPIAAHEGRLVTVELESLVLVSAYVPNSGQDLGRLGYRTDPTSGWDAKLAAYCATLERERGKGVLLFGDLNVAHDVRDMWQLHARPDFAAELAAKPRAEQYTGNKALLKQAGCTAEERDSFSATLLAPDAGGLVDTFRARHPDATGVFTYWSMRANSRPVNKGLRLDYVLASRQLVDDDAPAPRVVDSFILDSEYPPLADHAPIGCHVLL